jgi:hypothetical protein
MKTALLVGITLALTSVPAHPQAIAHRVPTEN